MKKNSFFTHLSKTSVNNQKGLTLIELMVSIGILVIVAGPFLGTILAATRNNAYSEQVLKSSVLMQKVMEEMKSRPNFLDIEAVLEADTPTADFREYIEDEGYRVTYKIVKKEETLSPLSQTYEFEDINDIPPGSLNFLVESDNVSLNGISYGLSFNLVPVNYFLEITETGGAYTYRFYDEYNPNLQTNSLSGVTGTEPVKIKIEYLNGSEDDFRLNVNLDGISESRDVFFYIIDDEKDKLSISNTGTKPFYQFDEVSSNYVEYFNVLYKIELVVERDGQELNRLISYVKKLR